jgi:seryl-tRNA synthetase
MTTKSATKGPPPGRSAPAETTTSKFADLPDQLEAVLERARTTFDREIDKSRKVVDNLNAEKAAAQTAIAELQAQRKSAQTQLDVALSNLHRGLNLATLDSETAKARKELERLKAETAQATKALEALAKQRTQAEVQLIDLGNEARRMVAIRVEGETVMADLRAKLAQVQIGVRP